MRALRAIVLCMLAVSLVSACSTGPATFEEGQVSSGESPTWVEAVVPEPGSVAKVPDAVEVEHTITSTNEDVRLLVDGVDVTTYATFDAGKIRYEGGSGPVPLDSGEHTAEVQRVRLPGEGLDYEVIDSFTWSFRIA